MPRLEALRARIGRPHWVVLGESHHLLPRSSGPAQPPPGSADRVGGQIHVTAHPDQVAATVLQHIDIALARGAQPQQVLAALGQTAEGAVRLEAGEALLWDRRDGARYVRIKLAPMAAPMDPS